MLYICHYFCPDTCKRDLIKPGSECEEKWRLRRYSYSTRLRYCGERVKEVRNITPGKLISTKITDELSSNYCVF